MTDTVFSLTDRRILVPGGTRGIGRAISIHFARAGASVVAGYVRDDAAAASLAEEGANERHPIELCRADLTTDAGLARMVDAAGKPLSALVYCAATGIHRPVADLTLRHWDFTFALNLRAFFALVTGVLPLLAEGSTIVGVSSQGAMQALPAYGLVAATKAGLESLCRQLAVELAPRGIRVNVLSPGNVLTSAWDAFPDKDARLAEAIRRSPQQRLTNVDEVANAAQFLCCDASAGINGHTLVVDGAQRVRG
jgi:NAD(P)-dependent dehydrogenase (short-subunit alcohol dehydrogenase family)